MLDGEKVWVEYKSLNEITFEKSYAELKIEISKVLSLMQFFTFNITRYNEAQKLGFFEYEYNGFYFIKNYGDFIRNGKFQRQDYIAFTGNMFF